MFINGVCGPHHLPRAVQLWTPLTKILLVRCNVASLAPLNLDLYTVGSCGFASVLLMHFDNCPFARQNFLKILDGGTASHLPSLLLTKPLLDLGWGITSQPWSSPSCKVECYHVPCFYMPLLDLIVTQTQHFALLLLSTNAIIQLTRLISALDAAYYPLF